MTTCLILWRSPLCSPNSYDLSRHGPWGCLVVSGTRAFYSGSSGSCMMGGGASMDQTCSAHLTDSRSDWDLRNLEARSIPWALYCVPLLKLFLSSVLGHILLLGGHCHQVVLLWWGGTWSTAVFWRVVRVQWLSQHQRFPNRTSYCDEMITVIYATCQWF